MHRAQEINATGLSEDNYSHPLSDINMSVMLPPEMLDFIVDHLYGDLRTLKACCIVSKSWIPRARRHLFVCVSFHAQASPIESWMKTFPDPPNSPAHYTRSLLFHDSSSITAANASNWIRAFCHIDALLLRAWDGVRFSFTHLHGLSPTLKSLFVACSFIPLSEFSDLVGSFPSLEDLSLTSTWVTDPDGGWSVIPPVSPKFTGKLWLQAPDRIQPVVQRLLGFPGGLHFFGIDVVFHEGETESVAKLLSRCSHTLESLVIHHNPSGVFLWLLGLLNVSPMGSDTLGRKSLARPSDHPSKNNSWLTYMR